MFFIHEIITQSDFSLGVMETFICDEFGKGQVQILEGK